MCELCTGFQTAHTVQSDILYSFSTALLARTTSTLWDRESLSQHNELSDKEVAELHHRKTWLFPVATTENSHALVF